jgi:SOS-response transcriptional repressor LexA
MMPEPKKFRRWKVNSSDKIILKKIELCGLRRGFPSSAAAYEQECVDMVSALVPNPAYSEFVETCGDYCLDRFMADPALVVVDHTELPRHNDLVYVRIDDTDSVRVYCVEFGKVVLRTANKARSYPAIYLSGDESIEIRGVIVHIFIDPRQWIKPVGSC